MKNSLFTSTLLLGSLVGCATHTSPPNASASKLPVAVAPAPATTPDMPPSEVAYTHARRAHGQGQLSLAAAHYLKALQADGGHVGALNGLGVIRAQEGRTDQALALFARSRDLSPRSAHVHNNIGYTLLQADRLTEARLALKLALELEPGSLQTLQNLRLLVEAERRAQRAASEAVREQPVVTSSGGVAGALVAVAPQVFELRTAAPVASALTLGANLPTPGWAAPVVTATPVTTPVSTAPTTTTATKVNLDLRRVQLEIANGVGVDRLATRTASQLSKNGVRVARLTNEKPYRQVRTQIRYVLGQESALQALTQHLPVSVERVAVPSLPAGMQLKLVLGQDFSGQAIAAWLDQPGSQRVTTRSEAVTPEA